MRVVLFLHRIYLIVYSLFLLLLLRFLHHPPRVNHFSNGLVENASSFAGAPIKRRTQESRRLAVLHRWGHILWRWIKCKATFFLLNNNECSSGTLIFFASCHQTIIAVNTNLINSRTKSKYEIQVPFQFPLFFFIQPRDEKRRSQDFWDCFGVLESLATNKNASGNILKYKNKCKFRNVLIILL